jgi:long-chain acyl-CoA synthetase
MGGIRLRHFASKSPDSLAIVDPEGKRWSRGEVAKAANKLARALQLRGSLPGEVLAILAPNCAEYLITYVAAVQIGLYVVPINWHLAEPEVRFILENCRAKTLVAHARSASVGLNVIAKMDAPPDNLVVIGGEIAGFSSFEEFTHGVDSSVIANLVEGRVLSYTSATTGKPKGVLLPLEDAERVADLALARRIAGGTRPEEHVFLCYSMLYHGAPLENATTALHMGQVVVLAQSFTPEGLLRLIEAHGVTQAYIVPTMFTRLLLLPESVRSRYSVASLQRVVHGGSLCPIDVKRRMIEWWGPILLESYGATEGAGTLVTSTDWMKYPGTVGRPIPDTELKIIGEQGEELPVGGVGTIYMTRYSGDKFEYLNDPEKTQASYRGEFFTVGDIGYINDAGFLFLCDRKIDMISLSGLKVYPAEIESVYLQHPYVADCAVFGVPDPRLGEAIVAFIQPSSSAPAPSEMKLEMVRFLGQHLSPQKHPRYIELVPNLGRDAAGKLQKRRLRDKYLSESTSTSLGAGPPDER